MSSSTDVSRIIFNQMSDTKYGTLIPTEGEFYVTPDYINLPLLTSMWFDHIVNDISWLRSDTFAWQSGDVYTAVYNHLVSDISGKTTSSETIGGVTISYYLADDGHKITTDETSVANIYTATGVAWYYVLDTTNHRFKLPITKFGFTGLRDNVGNYVSPGLPNITGSWTSQYNISMDNNSTCKGAIASTYNTDTGYYGSSSASSDWGYGFNFDASASNSIYGSSTTVQPPATQMYLYFYIGNFAHTATEQTAGITTAVLNNKMDNDLGNSGPISDTFKTRLNSAGIRYIKEIYKSGVNWYRIWSDDWIEQGGAFTWSDNGQKGPINLIIPFTTTNYFVVCQTLGTGADGSDTKNIHTRNTTNFYITAYDSYRSLIWYACGY